MSALVVLMAACVTGCATTRVPPDLDLSQAAIVLDATEPLLVVDGPTGMGVAVGAAGGAGTGMLVAVVGCVGTGLFYPLCLAALLPAMTAVGGIGGAVTGGLVTHSGAAVDAKRDLLAAELGATSYPALLVEYVQQQARDRLSIELPRVDTATTSGSDGGIKAVDNAARSWWIEVAMTQVASGRTLPDQQFAVNVEGRLKLHRGGDSQVVYEASRTAKTDASLTIAEWGANGGDALRVGLHKSLRALADKMLSDLVHAPADVRPGGLGAAK
jgi:hypothetical protein